MKVFLVSSMWILLSFSTMFVADATKFSDNCTYIGDTITCTHIPKNVDIGVKNVIFPISTSFTQDTFSGKGWGDILTIDFTGVLNTVIQNKTFAQLRSLEVIGIHSKNIISLESGSLDGLNNLRVLDLSGCVRLSFIYVLEILKNKAMIPNLQTLNLNKLNQLRRIPMTIFPIDRDLVNALLPRNISDIRLQHLMISDIDMQATIQLCSSLQTVDLSSTLIMGKIYRTHDKCKSLRNLIISSYNYQPVVWETYEPNTGFICDSSSMNYFQGVAIMRYDEVFRGNVPFICHACYITFTNKSGVGAGNYIQEIDFQNNKLKYFDVEFRGEQVFLNLTSISLARNKMEYINPKFFLGMKSIIKLDLSHNQLWKMQESNVTIFVQLFSHLSLLENLDLSYNDLNNLPKDMFLNNIRLKHLNLAWNILKSIHFSNSLSLSNLNISLNTITDLNLESRLWIDDCKQRNKNLKVDVSSNPFICLCSSMNFLHWLFESPSVFKPKSSFLCTYNGKFRIIQQENLKVMNKKLCHRTSVLIYSIISITGTIGVGVLIFFALKAAKKVRRIRERKRNRDENIASLMHDRFDDKYLAFLSFSSRDANLVMNSIYPSLVEDFWRYTNKQEDIVGVGDLHFRPGFCLHNEMIRCIEISNVFLAVLSENYCNSPYCRTEMDIAFSAEKPIILLLLGEVDGSKMSPVMKMVFDKYTRVKLYRVNGKIELRPTWKSLIDAILEMPTSRKEQEVLNPTFDEDNNDDDDDLLLLDPIQNI